MVIAFPTFLDPPESWRYYEKLRKDNYSFIEAITKEEYKKLNNYDRKIAEKAEFLLYPEKRNSGISSYERVPGWKKEDYFLYKKAKKIIPQITSMYDDLFFRLPFDERDRIRFLIRNSPEVSVDYLLLHFSMRIGNKNRKVNYGEGLYVDGKDIELVIKEIKNNKDANRRNKFDIKSIADIISEYSLYSKYLEDSEIKKTAITKTIESIPNFKKFNLKEYKQTIKFVSDFIDKWVTFPKQGMQKDSLTLSAVTSNLYGIYSYSNLSFNQFKESFLGRKNTFFEGYERLNQIFKESIREKNIVEHYLKHKKSPKKEDFINLLSFCHMRKEAISCLLPYIDKNESLFDAEDVAKAVYDEYRNVLKEVQSYEIKKIDYERELKLSSYGVADDPGIAPDIKLMIGKSKAMKDSNNFKRIFDNLSDEYKEESIKLILKYNSGATQNNQIDNYLSHNYSDMIAKVTRMNI